MILKTALCDLLGIDIPLVQAPIGSSSSPELAAAVATAGGLGMLAQTWFTPAECVDRLRNTRRLSAGPVGVNVILDFPIEERLEACLDEGAKIVSTFWGEPDRIAAVHATIHSAGALHLHTVGSAREAQLAVEAGADVIVAQGWEAGGHVRGTVATLPLVPAVVDAVHPVPVIAAGGIGDGRGLAAVLLLGAQAGWIGTRFLTATEAFTHDVYRQRVITAAGEDSVYTTCFDDGWPGSPGRALRNNTLTTWENAGHPRTPHRPGEGDIIATDTQGRQHLRYDDLMPLPGMQGQLHDMAMYAGQATGLIHDTAPAAQIIARIVKDATARLA